jgi:hypothetical protein
LNRLRHGKCVPPQQIDVLVYQGRQPGDIFRLHGRSLGAELLQSRINIERVPEDDNIHRETECAKLVFLPLTVALLRFRFGIRKELRSRPGRREGG